MINCWKEDDGYLHVNVSVDRPMGSKHPDRDTVYPINYGEVVNLLGGDGEWQDVYILGVDHPIKEFTGKVIAVIHRRDDVETKWVACPDNMTFDLSEIMRQVDFQEKWHDTWIEGMGPEYEV